MMTLKIALRNIFRHRVRSLITLSTIILGCVALIFVGGFFEDVFWQLRESFIRAQTGHIQIYRRGFNEHGKIEPYSYLINNAEEIKEIVRTLPEVRIITSRIHFSGLISTGETTISFIGQGIEPENERHLNESDLADLRKIAGTSEDGLPVISKGEALSKGDVKQVILGEGLAKTMKAPVGTLITVLTNTVRGSTSAMDVNIKGIFYTSSEDFDNIFLRLPMVTAQKLLGTQGVQTIILYIDKTENTSEVLEKLKKINAEKNLNLEFKRWEEMADFYNKTRSLFGMFYLIMRIVIAIVVVLGIFNTLNMSVMERISEIGTMMALGVRRLDVMKLFLIEGLLLGLIGGAIGIVLGTTITQIISMIGIWMPPAPGAGVPWLSQPKIVSSVLVSTFLLSTVVGGISALYPAYKASRFVVTYALRYR